MASFSAYCSFTFNNHARLVMEKTQFKSSVCRLLAKRWQKYREKLINWEAYFNITKFQIL